MYRPIIYCILSVFALPIQIQAQVNVKNATKAVVQVFTYDKEGQLLQSGTAFYTDKESNAVTSFDVFKHAYKAEIIDYKGEKHNVLRILGANSTTNLVKFSTDAPHKKNFFNITDKALAEHSSVNLVKLSNKKTDISSSASITGVEQFNNYCYYKTDIQNIKENITCPLVNENGSLAAIVQLNVDKKSKSAYAIDARFINELEINGTSALNSDLRAIHIPKGIPTNQQEALTYLYMFPAADSINNRIALNDFIQTYPQVADGYMSRATYFVLHQNYEECEKDFNTALEKASMDTTGLSLDYVHYNISDLIYNTVLSQKDTASVYKNWNLSRAEQEAQTAYSLNPNTLYLLQQAKILFTQGNYGKSYSIMNQVCSDRKFASSENYFLAARALELSRQDSLQVLPLLDSCIASLPQPVSVSDSHYYLERANRLIGQQRYREAVFDYNEYEKIVGTENLTADFYYQRNQLEMNAHMYQQALDDIRTAIAISNNELYYRIEEAYLLMRVGEIEDCIQTTKSILQEYKDNTECLKILGICYGTQGKKSAALDLLLKVQKSGDTSVDDLIKHYQN